MITIPIQMSNDVFADYSPSTTIGFDPDAYSQQNGYLSQYREYLASISWATGGQSIQFLSITPRSNHQRLFMR
jgi:hypothetical protein